METTDLKNELQCGGARVLHALDVDECTHVLHNDGAPDASAQAAVANACAVAAQHGVTVVGPSWFDERMAAVTPSGSVIAFERLVIDTSDAELHSFWCESGATLCPLHAASTGTIEDAGAGLVHLDFANRIIGGGVLGRGCVQEEIRFLICPELITSRLLVEGLADHEALLLDGFERFSAYTGYAHSFAYDGAIDDPPEHRPQLLAIDATHYRRHEVMLQFRAAAMERELNKALAGFTRAPSASDDVPLKPLCTGNWGCGAFGGDLQLKAMIQWAAASLAHRPSLSYLTFGDEALTSGLEHTTAELRRRGTSVGELVRLLRDFDPRSWPPIVPGVAGHYANVFGYLIHSISQQRSDVPSSSVVLHEMDARAAHGGDGTIGAGTVHPSLSPHPVCEWTPGEPPAKSMLNNTPPTLTMQGEPAKEDGSATEEDEAEEVTEAAVPATDEAIELAVAPGDGA